MKNLLKSAVAAAAFALGGAANASVIMIETGYSGDGPQGSAAAYQAVVNAAVAVPSPGYGAANVSIYDGISNQSLFGSPYSFAFKSTVNFSVSAANAGLWEIRSGVDFGYGGAIFVDGVALDTKTNDMWWGGAYWDPTQYFDVSLNLGAGSHTLNIYGLEGCCDGGQQAQFRIGNGDFVTFSNNDGLAADVPEPGSYAVLLAGLGLMGFTLRRKSSKN